MKRRVIVLEDDESLRLVISKALSRAGFEVRATASPETAINRMARLEADALVADVLLGRENFLDRLSEVRQLRPDAPVIVISAQTTVATALSANKAGAYEYLPKPFDINELTNLLHRALEGQNWAETRSETADHDSLLGSSPAMQATFKAIAKLAKTNVPVLITGPDGSGRASAGRLIHEQSEAIGPLIKMGPQEFGLDPERVWKEAGGGCLLLRRIETWTPECAAFVREKLESQTKSGPRLIATSGDLVSECLDPALVDLLAVGRIEMPPLYRRGNDRALLFKAFLEQAKAGFVLTKDGVDCVNSQAWPGEVLQLRRTAMHIVAQCNPGKIDRTIIVDAMRSPGLKDSDQELEAAAVRYFAASDFSDSEGLANRAIFQVERGLIAAALEASGGVRLEAARRLGMNRNTFARKLDQFDFGDGD